MIHMSEIESGWVQRHDKGFVSQASKPATPLRLIFTLVTGCYKIVVREWSDIVFSAGICFWLSAVVYTT